MTLLVEYDDAHELLERAGDDRVVGDVARRLRRDRIEADEAGDLAALATSVLAVVDGTAAEEVTGSTTTPPLVDVNCWQA